MKKLSSIRIFFPVYLLVFTGSLLLTLFGSRVVTVMSETAPLTGRHCIIVDPGHGGVDGGTTSCSGILESAINLEIALRMNDLLNLLGYDTLMTRTEDISIHTEGETIAAMKVSDLKQRLRIANETPNSVLLSIHQNYYSDSRYSGAQVFYPNDPSSEQLAKSMQTELVNALNPGSNRQAKRASGIYLMQHITCPGVLVECGFLSHPEEDAKLRSPMYQKKLCCVLAAILSKYLDP